MDFTDLQMTFTVVVILTAAAFAVFVDLRRKQRLHEPQRITIRNSDPPQRSISLFDMAPLDCGPAKKLAAERPLEPLVAIATLSRPPVQARERETVTVEMAPPSPSAPSSRAELQLLGVNLPAFTIDAALWERLIGSQSKQNLIEAPPTLGSTNTLDAVYNMLPEDGEDVAPGKLRGMVQRPALEELLDSQEPFSGLVVSIGINDSDSSMWHSQGLMQSVGTYIASLLKGDDFSCRTAYDEFVMVCRGEQGAESQRRMNRISERLWDYQLRGIGSCSILFSWGGVQVQDQPLAEAIASATERMRQTKRSGPSDKSALAHRQAV
jgi:hypothetical protein